MADFKVYDACALVIPLFFFVSLSIVLSLSMYALSWLAPNGNLNLKQHLNLNIIRKTSEKQIIINSGDSDLHLHSSGYPAAQHYDQKYRKAIKFVV